MTRLNWKSKTGAIDSSETIAYCMLNFESTFRPLNYVTTMSARDSAPESRGGGFAMPISNTSPNIQFWIAGTGAGQGLFKVNGDPSNDAGMTGYELAQFYAATTDNLLTTTIAEGLFRSNDIVFDTVHGKFFIADSDGAGHNRVLQGNIADLLAGNPPSLTILYQDTGSGLSLIHI